LHLKIVKRIEQIEEMDYKGQERSEKLGQKLLIIVGAFSFLTGYIRGSFGLMMGLFAIGFLISFGITVPNWPMYNRDPISWTRSTQQQKKKPAAGTASILASIRKILE